MTSWHYEKDGERHGPVTEQQLKDLASSGQLQPSSLIWQSGMEQWQPASSLDVIDWPQPVESKPDDLPPPLPPSPPQAASPTPAAVASVSRPMDTIESVRQYLGSLKTLRFSFPTSWINQEMPFTNEVGQTVLWFAKADKKGSAMALWCDDTKSTPLLRVVKQKGNLSRWDAVSISGENIGSLEFKFFKGWHIHLPDGRVVRPVNRVSKPKLIAKLAAAVCTAGFALLALMFLLMLLNPRPLWSLMSVGKSFSLEVDGQEVCAVKKQGTLLDVYYQVDDLSSVASKVDPALLVAALGMESASAMMTL